MSGIPNASVTILPATLMTGAYQASIAFEAVSGELIHLLTTMTTTPTNAGRIIMYLQGTFDSAGTSGWFNLRNVTADAAPSADFVTTISPASQLVRGLVAELPCIELDYPNTDPANRLPDLISFTAKYSLWYRLQVRVANVTGHSVTVAAGTLPTITIAKISQ